MPTRGAIGVEGVLPRRRPWCASIARPTPSIRWADVDLTAGMLTIAHNRVSVNGQAMDSKPKTDKSARVLPLHPELSAALRRGLAVQKAERLAARA